MRNYHEDLLDEFGDDLERIFGPTEERTKGLTSLAGQPDGDLKTLLNTTVDQYKLIGYTPMDSIKAPMAV